MPTKRNKPLLGKLVRLPNRPKELPAIYLAKTTHPLWIGKGQAYVYLQDLSKKAMKDRFEYEQKQEIPIGTDDYVQHDLGEYIMLSVHLCSC